jgi:hypothetical protein
MKEFFYKRTKEINFLEVDMVVKWDARRESKRKHGKFDNLWLGPFQVVETQENNTYEFDQLDGDLFGAHVNGRFFKHLFQY